MSALNRIKNIARGTSADPPVKEKPGVVSDMFLPSPEEQLRITQLEASGFPMDQYVPPNSRKQKTSYQKKKETKKEFHKDQLETNPNRLEGESEEIYKLRQQQFANRIKEYDAKFNKYLEKPGIGKAYLRGYNNLKKSQEKLSFIPRTLSEVFTSPVDVGFKASEMKDKRRNLLLNEDQKTQQWYSLGGSGLDMAALATLGRYLPAAQTIKTAFNLSKKAVPFAQKVGLLGAAGFEIAGQALEDQFGYAFGLKEKNQNKN